TIPPPGIITHRNRHVAEKTSISRCRQNSALALPAGLEVAAVVAAIQTLVEVLGMVACVRLVPRLVLAPERVAADPAAR
ncbi:hypothetical protein ACFP50_35620, partial [Streptomyces pratens]